jgi:Kef-type K+ transport system membrane component KefB
MGLLLGLLLVSYLGSSRSGRWSPRFGSPSATEYVMLGLLLGPFALGLIDRSGISEFEPILVAGASWLALVAGVGYGGSATRHGLRFAVLGALLTLIVALGVGAAVLATLDLLAPADTAPGWVLAAAVATVGSATTHQGVRWTVARSRARGPLAASVIDATRASPVAPALVLATICAAAPGHGLIQTTLLVRVSATVGIGAALGAVAALLLGREFRRDESWGILLGSALLGAGVAARLGLSAVAAMFTFGIVLSASSPHRAAIRTLVAPTDRAVLLPVALLAGASLKLAAIPNYWVLLLAALGSRLFMDSFRGWVFPWLFPTGEQRTRLGLGLMSTGGFTLAAALELDSRLGDPMGPFLLLLAAAGNLVGELLAPSALRAALERAGELAQPASDAPASSVGVRSSDPGVSA